MTTQPLYQAHDVADLFNLLPAAFGFMPEESVCAIATTGPRHRLGFRLRADLPRQPEHVPQLGRFVAGHLRNNGADGAVVLVVSERVADARAAAWAVERSLGAVRPVVTAWTDGSRYWTTFDDDPVEGTPLELSGHHPAVVGAVLAGREVLPDRAALEARWRPVTGPATAWLAAQLDLVEREVVGESWRAREDHGRRGAREVLGLVRLVQRDGVDAVSARSVLRLAVWLTSGGVRDRVWPTVLREDAEGLLPAWRELARRVPSAHAAVPYTLAAYLAYVLGDGAQAAIGLQEALRADPAYTMASTLAEALSAGTRPEQVRALVEVAFQGFDVRA
jgi:hypothetical protein